MAVGARIYDRRIEQFLHEAQQTESRRKRNYDIFYFHFYVYIDTSFFIFVSSSFNISFISLHDAIIAWCSADDEEARKKRKLAALSEDDTGPSVLCDDSSLFSTVQPLRIAPEWIEPDKSTKRLSVALLLQSGVTSGQFSVRVAEDGCALECSMCWPALW